MTDRGGSTYSWTYPGDVSIIGDPSASTATLNFGNNGGTVSVIETTASGCVTAHDPYAVTVNPLPTATISNGGNVCQGNDQPLQVSFTGTGPWSFVYAQNGADQPAIATADNPHTLDVNLAGSYTISSVSDANTCSIMDSVILSQPAELSSNIVENQLFRYKPCHKPHQTLFHNLLREIRRF